MCQVAAFMQLSGRTLDLYNMVDLDDVHGVAYQRFAIHTTYELDGTYEETSRRIVLEGLCRALGDVVVPACAEVGRALVDHMTFSYAVAVGGWTWTHPGQQRRLDTFLLRFQAAERESRS